MAADENGFVSNYWYDADGERTVKTSGENEAIYVNSEFSGGNTGTARFSLYVSPYLVAGQGGKYTKHIYVGSQRIVSKLGDLASYGADPRRIPYAGNEADGLTVDYKKKYGEQLQAIKENYKAFDQPYNGKDNDDYVNGQGFCCNDGTPEAAQARAMARTRAANGNFKPNDNYEKMQFYYHPDYLGSSSYITNLDGEVAQHIEYVPFGEVFIEESNNTWNTPYLFNAKEFDEETGLYYYGARYYDPRLSLWMSTDPKEENYPDVNSYSYTKDNPANFIDSHGMEPEEAQNTPKPQKSKKIYYAPDSQKKLITGYPGQAAEELLIKGIQWLGQKVSGEKISEESSENIQLISNLTILLVSKGKNTKLDSEFAGQVAKRIGFTSKSTKILGTTREYLLNTAKNPKLKNIISDLYRPGAKIGSGSSMDAFRFEQKTGQLVGGKSHSIKLLNYRTALQRLWRSRSNLSEGDKKIVKRLLTDVQNALSGH